LAINNLIHKLLKLNSCKTRGANHQNKVVFELASGVTIYYTIDRLLAMINLLKYP